MTATFEQQTASLQNDIDKAKAQLDFAKSLAFLKDNKHFRKVFVEGFMRDEAARFAGMSVQLGVSPEDRAHAIGMAQAAGYLAQWISVREQMAQMAERSLEDAEASLDALRQDSEE